MKILSLGWGVQSWTMVAMVALGELEPVDFVIHADTSWEMSTTYKFAEKWTPWLEDKGIKITVVSDSKCTKKVVDIYGGVFIPAFTLSDDGKKGKLWRQCTGRWKIQPVRREISRILKEKELKKSPAIIELWLGITTDEAHRISDSNVKYIKNTYPLLDIGYSRLDCIQWLKEHDLPNPGRSSCTCCPFHTKAVWEEMKLADGEDWKEAVMVDKAIRNKRPPFPLFLHQNRVPLEEAVK